MADRFAAMVVAAVGLVSGAACTSETDGPEMTTVAGSTGDGSSSGDDSGSTGSMETTSPPPTTTPPPTSDTVTASTTSDTAGSDRPTFANDVQPIFESRCSQAVCHGSSQFPEVALYDGIVYAASSVSGLSVVEPSSKEDSYLWYKINGSMVEVGGDGTRMPPGGGLSSADIELIGEWIDRGAAR